MPTDSIFGSLFSQGAGQVGQNVASNALSSSLPALSQGLVDPLAQGLTSGLGSLPGAGIGEITGQMGQTAADSILQGLGSVGQNATPGALDSIMSLLKAPGFANASKGLGGIVGAGSNLYNAIKTGDAIDEQTKLNQLQYADQVAENEKTANLNF